ncbi:MAG: 23S rRNA (guanosine(2251)-2'-O)-methyltransferase RlmB [Deltaproteobacteria bacterium]|nr:23S rRNA (guanosine(2251)-2'-O)-methyltransferase RlmB [Deltaproteobacteria bacterium]
MITNANNRVIGLRAVQALLAKGSAGRTIRQLFFAERGAARELIDAAKRADISTCQVTTAALDELAGGGVHQGVVALVGDYAYVDMHALLEDQRQPLLLLVDGVTDPQNLGAMMRAALVLGATGIVLTKDRCAQINATVTRVACGATEYLPCARVTNLVRAIAELKEAEVWVAGTVESGGQHPADVDLRRSLAIVLGSEGRGMRPLVVKQCDFLLTIPALGEIAALNVGTATGVVLYEVSRQRRSPPGN